MLRYLSHILRAAAGSVAGDQRAGAGRRLTTGTVGVERLVGHGLADVVGPVGMDGGAGNRGHTGDGGGEGGVAHLDNLLARCKTEAKSKEAPSVVLISSTQISISPFLPSKEI